MDTPASESSALSVDGAAQAFAALLEPATEVVEDTPSVDTEIEVKKPEKPQAETPAEEVSAETTEEGEEAPLTIEVDGKQVTLTKAEIAEAYKNGLRQEDYTKKTMAAAEQRKAAEAELQKTQQERIAYAQSLTEMAAQLKGAIQQQENIDWDKLLEQNPVEFMRQKHLFDQRQALLQKNQREQSELKQKVQAEQAESLKAYVQTQQQELLAKLPEWKDEAKASSEKAALKEYLLKEGYESAAVDGINDHRAVILARKAMLYDQMMDKARVAAKKVANVPTKVERPGVQSERSPMDGRTAAMRQLSKTGSFEDAARAFASIL